MRDEMLIWQVRKGNKEAMQHLIEEYYDDIYRYCYHHVESKEQAQDLTQDTFYRMFMQLSDYKHYGKFLNYLYVIAGNLCKDFYKKHRPVYMAELPEGQEEKAMYSIDEKITLEQEINLLPTELKEVILLRYYQNRKIQDIAKIQGVSTALVHYREKKALDRLRLHMEQEDRE